jgi:cell division protein FtsI/penicillin-binding protein 2
VFAHVVGYVGRIDEKDQAALGDSGGAYTHTGKTGLERYYEAQLRGKPGFRRLETNVDGRTVRALDTVPATPGTDLRLSIDIDLQRAMVDAFAELEGTAVAVDPRTGEILAMVSLPSYDPNLFVNGISRRLGAQRQSLAPAVQPRSLAGGAGVHDQAVARACRPRQRVRRAEDKTVDRHVPCRRPAPAMATRIVAGMADRPAQVDLRIGQHLLLPAG